MSHFNRKNGVLHAEEAALADIAASIGTPCYVYSRLALEAAYREFAGALAGHDAMVCYAVKANSNLAILNLFAELGAGFDIVSEGELERVLAAGGKASRTVFAGVGKTAAEMRRALQAGVMCLNVESEGELERLSGVATAAGLVAAVSLRVNPDVDPKTHPYIATGLEDNKFGVPIADAPALYRKAAGLPGLRVTGVDCHIGSQITESAPFLEALDKVLALVDQLASTGIHIEHLDMGGGIGIRYRDETPPDIGAHFARVLDRIGKRPLKLLVEPGRALVGNAGLLLTRVEYLKHGKSKNFAIVDAAMNDLMRPALYDAWHDIVPVAGPSGQAREYDVVGPVCESGDFLGRGRALSVHPGDLLAIMSAGAYGMSMSSNYNTRPRAAEVLVDGASVHVVRPRERLADLFATERVARLDPR